MKKIICESCRKRYDYDRDETCPKCGTYNRPARRPQSFMVGTTETRPSRPTPVLNTAGNRNEGKKSVAGKKVAGIVVLVAIIKIVLSFVGHFGDELKEVYSPDFSSVGVSIEEAAVQESYDEQAVDDEQLSSAGDSTPEADINSLRYSSDTFDFQPADGVHIVVNEYGILKGGPIDGILDDGNQCVYVDITFAVTDFDEAASADVTEPYLELDGEYYNSLAPDEFYGRSDCTPMDYTPIGEGADAVTGQLYFAIPEDADSFQLCWDSSDGDTQSFEIPFVPIVTTKNV